MTTNEPCKWTSRKLTLNGNPVTVYRRPAPGRLNPETGEREPSGRFVHQVRVGRVHVAVNERLTPSGCIGWLVSNYADGKRRLDSYKTEVEALEAAHRIAKQLAEGEVMAASLRNEDASIYAACVQAVAPTGVPLLTAATHFAEAVKILGGDRIIEAARFLKTHNPDQLPDKSVADAVAELLAAKASKRSGRYLEDLRARLNRFGKDFPCPIANVTGADVQRWLDGLKVGEQTQRNFRTVVGTLFRFAEARGYILKGSNPVADTERVEVANGEAVEIYKPEELARLLAAAPGDFAPCIALGAFAGLRSAEIERQRWEDIDLAGGHIVVTKGKVRTAGRRVVPILPALAEWLRPHAKRSGAVWTGTHDGFYDRQTETAEATRVEADPKAGTKAADPVPWKHNALRHSFISYRLAETQNKNQVAEEAGNSASMIVKHYRELVKPAQAKAWFGVRPAKPANVVPMRSAAQG